MMDTDSTLQKLFIAFLAALLLCVIVLSLLVGYDFIQHYEARILKALYIAFIVFIIAALYWFIGFVHHDVVSRSIKNEKARSKIAHTLDYLPSPVTESEENSDYHYFGHSPAEQQQGRGEDLSDLFEKRYE